MYIYKLDKKNVSSFGNNEIDCGKELTVQTNLNY